MPQRQMIPNAVATRLIDNPEMSVLQTSGANSWVEVNDDGSLTVDGAAAPWRVYMNSGSTQPLTESAQPADVQIRLA